MKPSLVGNKQSVVYRDKYGKKRNFEKESEERLEKQKEQDEINEKYTKWGKG